MRILAATRLSRDSDESTSIERQEEHIRSWAALHGHDVVAVAVDTDASGAIPPAKRPDLGQWMKTARLGRWDALTVWKLDRLSRSLFDFADLVRWAKYHSKHLVSVSENIDFSTASGRAYANMLITFADFERERMRERRADHARKARELAHWDGRAVVPGYRPVKVDSHYELVPDLERVKQIKEMAELVCAGVPARQVEIRLGLPEKSCIRTLRNHGLRGLIIHQGKSVRAPDGSLVTREPVLGETTWGQVQAALDKQGRLKTRAAGNEAMLLGVVVCADCEQPLYTLRREGLRPYYRHRDRKDCGARSIWGDVLEEQVEEKVLAELGDLPIVEKIEPEISSYQPQLDDIERELRSLDFDQPDFLDRQAALLAERKRVQEIDTRVSNSGIGWRPLAETHAERWGKLDSTGRAAYLRSQEVKVRARQDVSGVKIQVEFGLRDQYIAECAM